MVSASTVRPPLSPGPRARPPLGRLTCALHPRLASPSLAPALSPASRSVVLPPLPTPVCRTHACGLSCPPPPTGHLQCHCGVRISPFRACIHHHVLTHSWLPGRAWFQLLAAVNVLQWTWVCLDPDAFLFWIPSGLYLAPELHSHLVVLCLTKSHFLNLGQQPWKEPPSLVQLGPECHAYGIVPKKGE